MFLSVIVKIRLKYIICICLFIFDPNVDIGLVILMWRAFYKKMVPLFTVSHPCPYPLLVTHVLVSLSHRGSCCLLTVHLKYKLDRPLKRTILYAFMMLQSYRPRPTTSPLYLSMGLQDYTNLYLIPNSQVEFSEMSGTWPSFMWCRDPKTR
jgi:hypothetical protein